MHRTTKTLSGALLYLLFTANFNLAQHDAPDFHAALDAIAPGLLVEHRVPGLSVAYLENGIPKVTIGYGFAAEPASNKRMTATTSLNVASVSKAVTSRAILELMRDINLDFDQPVNELLVRWRLPESDARTAAVTIGRLLSHTAGLNVPSVPIVPLSKPPMVLERALAGDWDGTQVEIVHRPGLYWQYSGGGYMVLELLVEEVTQLPFDEFMRNTIFEPNRMEASTFSPTDDEIRVGAIGFGSNGTAVAPYRLIGAAAGGLMTTALDMSRFLSSYMMADDSGSIKPTEIATQLLQVPVSKVTIPEVENGWYGYGHGVSGEGRNQTLYHSGGNPGILAYLIVAPNRGTGLFLAVNSNRGAAVLTTVLELWSEFHQLELPPIF